MSIKFLAGLGGVTDLRTAHHVLDQGLADLISVGRQFLADPDLLQRWRIGATLNEPDPTFHSGAARGYAELPRPRVKPTACPYQGIGHSHPSSAFEDLNQPKEIRP